MELHEAAVTVAEWRRDGKDAGLRHLTPHLRDALDTLVAHARRSLEEPRAELAKSGERDPHPEITNLVKAVELTDQIAMLRAVVREVRSAFARSELDGGVQAAPEHPLYIQAEAEIAKLHEQLMVLI